MITKIVDDQDRDRHDQPERGRPGGQQGEHDQFGRVGDGAQVVAGERRERLDLGQAFVELLVGRQRTSDDDPPRPGQRALVREARRARLGTSGHDARCRVAEVAGVGPVDADPAIARSAGRGAVVIGRSTSGPVDRVIVEPPTGAARGSRRSLRRRPRSRRNATRAAWAWARPSAATSVGRDRLTRQTRRRQTASDERDRGVDLDEVAVDTRSAIDAGRAGAWSGPCLHRRQRPQEGTGLTAATIDAQQALNSSESVASAIR